jgi:hypothetical protein
MKKNILLLDATPDNSVPLEIIECVAKSYDYDVQKSEYFDKQQFENNIKHAARATFCTSLLTGILMVLL